MPLTDLPPEILSSISSYLDYKDSCILRLTSKILSEIAAPGVFGTVYFGFFLESLEKLHQISTCPTLRIHVKKLIACGEALPFAIKSDANIRAIAFGDAVDDDELDPKFLVNYHDDDVPVGITFKELPNRPYTTIGVPSAKSRRYWAPYPIRAIGPCKGKPVVLREGRYWRICSFHDANGEMITHEAWKQLSGSTAQPTVPQRHNKYAFEQFAWPEIAANRLERILGLFPNVRDIVITPSTVRFQQSETFWYNMRSKLYFLPCYDSGSTFAMHAAQPAICCLLNSIASLNWSLTSLEVVLQLSKQFDESKKDLAVVRSVFRNLRKLNLGLARDRERSDLPLAEAVVKHVMKSVQEAQHLQSLHLWLKATPPETVLDQALIEAHWPRLSELNLGYFSITEIALRRLFIRHASTLRILDLKSLKFQNASDRWLTLIPAIPHLLPNLEWFWIDDLVDETIRDVIIQFQSHTFNLFYDFPLRSAVQYWKSRRALRTGTNVDGDTAAKYNSTATKQPSLDDIFEPRNWPQMSSDGDVALEAEMHDLWEANGSSLTLTPDNPGFRHIRRQIDNIRRREVEL